METAKENNRNIGNVAYPYEKSQSTVMSSQTSMMKNAVASGQEDDTEEFIRKVSSRFEEAKKLMNES